MKVTLQPCKNAHLKLGSSPQAQQRHNLFGFVELQGEYEINLKPNNTSTSRGRGC